MRIEVIGSPAVHVDRLRAYAEYRVFSRLAVFGDQVKTVRIVISRSTDDRPTSCVMSAELRHGIWIQTRSRNTQPARVVDSAAKKLAEATSNQLPIAVMGMARSQRELTEL